MNESNLITLPVKTGFNKRNFEILNSHCERLNKIALRRGYGNFFIDASLSDKFALKRFLSEDCEQSKTIIFYNDYETVRAFICGMIEGINSTI